MAEDRNGAIIPTTQDDPGGPRVVHEWVDGDYLNQILETPGAGSELELQPTYFSWQACPVDLPDAGNRNTAIDPVCRELARLASALEARRQEVELLRESARRQYLDGEYDGYTNTVAEVVDPLRAKNAALRRRVAELEGALVLLLGDYDDLCDCVTVCQGDIDHYCSVCNARAALAGGTRPGSGKPHQEEGDGTTSR